MIGPLRLVAYLALVLLVAPALANLYADLCARLVVRLECSPDSRISAGCCRASN